MISAVDISDEELTAQALAADPDEALDARAVPFRGDEPEGADLLPAWYMPRPALGQVTTGKRVVAVTLVTVALIINGLGFCLTYGHLTAG